MNPLYAPLGSDSQRFVWKTARDCYLHRFAVFGAMRPSRQQVREHFERRFEGSGRFRRGYRSSLLLMLAVRLAVALFFYWLENQFAAIPNEPFAAGEPGTLSYTLAPMKRLWRRKT